MKSYTDLEQSKKLAEILPLESADMRYAPIGDIHPWVWEGNPKLLETDSTPCWSLAALLELIRNFQPNNQSALFVGKEDGYQYMSSVYLATHEHNNPIDVCYVMILKLHEQKLL